MRLGKQANPMAGQLKALAKPYPESEYNGTCLTRTVLGSIILYKTIDAEEVSSQSHRGLSYSIREQAWRTQQEARA